MRECKGRSGAHIDVLCRNCDEKDYDPHPYVTGLYEMALLLESGFPVDSERFEIGYWIDLGLMRLMFKRTMSGFF